MGITAKIVLALGMAGADFLAYSYADTQDKLIKLDNESRSARQWEIDEYNTFVGNLRDACREEKEACDQQVLLDYGANLNNTANFQKAAEEVNQCMAQRRECGDKAVDTAYVLVDAQWQNRRYMYDALLCSPDLVARVGFKLDFLVSMFSAEPPYTGEQGAVRFFRDREWKQEQDCGTRPGPSFYSLTDFYADAPTGFLAGR